MNCMALQKRLPWLLVGFVVWLTLGQDAFAHTVGKVNESAGFREGFLHPLTGLDHVLAMVSVGLWAGQIKNPMGKFLVPTAFAGVMVLGALAGLLGAPAPYPEQGIATSVLVLGLLVATQFDLAVYWGMLIVASFGVCHGSAHGTEFHGVANSALPYFVGFSSATVMMHVLGVLLSFFLQKTKETLLLRGTGAVVSVLGVLLLARSFGAHIGFLP